VGSKNYCPPGTLSIHPNNYCPTRAAEGKPVVRWCHAMLPLYEHIVLCELGVSSYGTRLPSVQAAKLVDGRSTVQVSGQVIGAPYFLSHTTSI
jgi:hypothetical protein